VGREYYGDFCCAVESRVGRVGTLSPRPSLHFSDEFLINVYHIVCLHS